MVRDGLLLLLQKPATRHYTKQICVVAAKNWGIFDFHNCENKIWYNQQ
jgi:hypothetical protein